MRKDTSFSCRQLSRDEFSRKYWMNGEAPDQYHTMEIEDGRDEVEQLIINDLRALKAANARLRRRTNERAEFHEKRTAAAIAVATAAMVGLNLVTFAITTAQIRRCHPKVHNRR